MKAGELCTREVVTANPGESALDVARRMTERGADTVVVVDERAGEVRPVGTFTERDLVTRALARGDVRVEELRIADVMRTDLTTASDEDDVDAVLANLDRHGIGQVPVVDRHGLLVGVLGRDDILRTTGARAPAPSPREPRHPLARALGGGIVGGLIAGAVLGVVVAVLASLQGYDLVPAMKLAGLPVLGDRALAPGFDVLALAVGMLGYLVLAATFGAVIGLFAYRASRPAIVSATRRERPPILRPAPAKLV